MAILPPMVLEQSAFALKSEATTGTEESGIGAADGTTVVWDPEITEDEDFYTREGQGSLDPHEGMAGAQVAAVKFTTEMPGSGTATAAVSFEPALLAAGLNVTVGASRVYNPVTGSPSMTTLTCGHYVDGEKFCARGVSLDFTIKGQAGRPPMIEWTGRGAWVDPSAVALITPTYVTSPIPPRLVNQTLTIGGSAYIIRAFEFTPGNVISVRRNIGSLGGIHSTAVVNRKAALSIDIEASTSKLWHSDFTTGSQIAVSIGMGTVAGNAWTLAVPKAQLNTPPAKIDMDGVLGWRLRFQTTRVAAAGDDAWTLTHA